MLNLSPNEIFTIYRPIDDPSDSNTYYPQAVIRDAKTGDTLETVNLTQASGTPRRYSYNWQVANDPGGQGRYITIDIYTYTDSGHTTLSQIYGVRSDTYLIQNRWNRVLGGGAGGVDISYEKIRKLIEEEIKKIPKEEPKPLDLSGVYDKITELKDIVRYEIENIPEFPKIPPFPEIPKPEKVDLGKIDRLLSGLSEQVSNLPKSKDIDLERVENYLSKVLVAIQKMIKIQEETNKIINERPRNKLVISLDDTEIVNKNIEEPKRQSLSLKQKLGL